MLVIDKPGNPIDDASDLFVTGVNSFAVGIVAKRMAGFRTTQFIKVVEFRH